MSKSRARHNIIISSCRPSGEVDTAFSLAKSAKAIRGDVPRWPCCGGSVAELDDLLDGDVLIDAAVVLTMGETEGGDDEVTGGEAVLWTEKGTDVAVLKLAS